MANTNHTDTSLVSPLSAERIPPKGRIVAFDALRSLAIFGVVVTHVSMTYMPNNLGWWYVASEKTDNAFLILVHIFDICIIPLLFFIAGYFTSESYRRKGFAGFLVDKIKHILVPWLLGIAVVNPLSMLLSVERPVETIAARLAEDPFYLFVSQGHVWYLGILLLFFVVYALWARLVPPSGMRRSEPKWKSASLLAVCIAVASISSCLAVSDIGDYYKWEPFMWIWRLRPVKIASYVCFFLLGIYGWRTKWFTAEGWMPRIGWWRVSAIGSMIGYLILRIVTGGSHAMPTFFAMDLLPAADTLFAFCSLIYLLLAAIRYQRSRIVHFFADLAAYSYGIYWVHAIPLFFYLRAVNEMNAPIFFKWLIGIAFTCAVSWLVCKYILKKTPGLRQMF